MHKPSVSLHESVEPAGCTAQECTQESRELLVATDTNAVCTQLAGSFVDLTKGLQERLGTEQDTRENCQWQSPREGSSLYCGKEAKPHPDLSPLHPLSNKSLKSLWEGQTGENPLKRRKR